MGASQGYKAAPGTAAEETLTERGVESVLFRGRKLSERTNGEKLELFAAELIKEQERRQRSPAPTVVIKPSMTPARSSSSTLTTMASTLDRTRCGGVRVRSTLTRSSNRHRRGRVGPVRADQSVWGPPQPRERAGGSGGYAGEGRVARTCGRRSRR
ncbi:hypothetical protein B296_00041989 [Ensete ventricosum]|uniref:Uncharacterized protein n=1 Tax=Ensete ventricosum TaxID=4639 RepID=A0A426XHT4_ENSVE|nr:hypothetical protein B296_00041989 [Ensete ventricosum]